MSLFVLSFYCRDEKGCILSPKAPPVLIYFLQLCVQRSLIFNPVREDVSHGATGLVETQVEAIGVNLWTIGDFEH